MDQGAIGSCTGNAIAGAFGFLLKKQNKFTPLSRLFIYWNERVMEGDTQQDGGAQIRDGILSVIQKGAAPEELWPYQGGNLFAQPPDDVFRAALLRRVTTHYGIWEPWHMRHCLAAGYPFVFGFTVYESFESAEVASTGMVPMPGPSEQVLGGHAVMAVGYDTARKVYIVRNSWGTGWGDGGYFYMPFDYVESRWLADDFWTIRADVA